MEKASTETGIRDFKAHLSAYLRRAEAGETITITRRGEPVGRLGPPRKEPAQEENEPTVLEKMKALQEAGLIEWSGKKPPSREPVAKGKGDRMVSDLLLEDRR